MDDPVGLTISDPLGLAVAKGACPVGLPPSQSSRASTHRQQSGSVGASREATLFASAPARCRPLCLWPWAAGRGTLSSPCRRRGHVGIVGAEPPDGPSVTAEAVSVCVLHRATCHRGAP